MKKFIIGLLALILFTAFYLGVTHNNSNKFFLLNWGEYIDEELISKFESEFDVIVVMDEVGSSEAMYSKISSGTTRYDVAIPGDYIIQKLYNNNLLVELDHSLLTNYQLDMFHDDLISVMNSDDFYKDALNYAMPYFWGAYSILYSTQKEGLSSIVENNGFDVFYNRELTNSISNVKIGMYDVPRWATSSYLLNNNMDVNTIDLSLFSSDYISSVSSVNYDLWGNDILKKQIANGNLDLAFVQLGDFFDQHYVTSADNLEVKFNAYVPDNTAAFFDGMVIPTTSNNVELAHEFINFFLDSQNSLQNALYVGYCPTIKEVVNLIKNDDDMKDFVTDYPFYLDPIAGKDAVLFNDLGSKYESDVIELINKAKKDK